jgi:hypothetical protein
MSAAGNAPLLRQLSDGRQPGNNPESHGLSGQVLVNALTGQLGSGTSKTVKVIVETYLDRRTVSPQEYVP